MLEVGQIKEVNILDLNYLGKGVAKVDDFVVFVEDAIEGDYVEIEITEVKKNYAIGRVLSTINPSKNRIEPPCQYYTQCGGCQLMHINYDEQSKFKKTRVINELKRVKVNLDNVSIHDTIEMKEPFRYRNKTAFSVKNISNKVVIGPYEQGTYNTVDINTCMLQSSVADKVITLIKKAIKKYNIKPYDKKTKTGTIRSIVIRNNKKNELMLIIVTVSEKFQQKDIIVKELVNEIKELKTIIQNINSKNTNLVMGDKNIVLYGEGTIKDNIGDLIFNISPNTFFQVNPIQTEKLYDTALKYANLNKEDICFDIYCGIGTISLMASKYAKKVYGIEIVEQSIINARENAKLNNIKNAEFYAGKAEKILPKLYSKNIKGNVVILDPPRKGCEKEVIDTIINMNPEKVVYVSCNPSTLARDIKLLESGGYKLKIVQPVDQFPWTVHVECVILMQRSGIEDKK
ncbi:23S rRNA (uracil(1939)-C(5))-methyltransferase RlmD [Sedimentibacter sp. MB31-C6]|uniref:23S rRNA (uracil(1939)-C(5))-methyltransferase RlmD n=1 Tax=Sedimentibacter sp. MB31-C6 TaxID=3109366 RepID=UPI002DDD921F|nr:23S rRNA (uracil(1939)-C(5))-methyltransferase RlmD [Sedimentibacter sp. MB36-C1]WSI03455.1 23S rRNA (uracil(1939)-C(5))-methyltransferase RlmD [Sedimentibacter sp. MB36-C1]